MQKLITYTYERNLQAVLNDIGNRGIRFDVDKLKDVSRFIEKEVQRNLSIASKQWSCHVFAGKENDLDKDDPNKAFSININSTQGAKSLLARLKDIGYEIPLNRKKTEEGDYEYKESTDELAIQKMILASLNHEDKNFLFPGGDPALKAILRVRELNKIKTTYIQAKLVKESDNTYVYLTSYNAAGTLTGRRSSRQNTFGFGNNNQNFPKHGELSSLLRECLISRPNRIFLFVDQKSAEEWPVNALAENYQALSQLKSGVNRHKIRAGWLFNIPQVELDKPDWKEKNDLLYFLGKKVGHANNYGMGGQTFADSLIREGKPLLVSKCNELLEKENQREPSIRGVFHKYIESELSSKRVLITPLGRERQFLGLRSNSNANGKIFREAYSYIPQSTVGDNNGLAILYLESMLPHSEQAIIQDCHDSICQDISNKAVDIWRYLRYTSDAYNRIIRFNNGIEINIPIEAELGYSFHETVKIKEPFSLETVTEALKICNEKRDEELENERRNQKDKEKESVLTSI
jgi:DNA polymerase family A